MLIKNDLINFFEMNDIPLNGELELSTNQVDFLFINANKVGVSFSAFILCAVINSDKNGLATSFDNEDNLYDCYCCFMTGFLKKNNYNN